MLIFRLSGKILLKPNISSYKSIIDYYVKKRLTLSVKRFFIIDFDYSFVSPLVSPPCSPPSTGSPPSGGVGLEAL